MFARRVATNSDGTVVRSAAKDDVSGFDWSGVAPVRLYECVQSAEGRASPDHDPNGRRHAVASVAAKRRLEPDWPPFDRV